jgi:hypothetical protein
VATPRPRSLPDASKTDISRSGEAVKALGEILQRRSHNAPRARATGSSRGESERSSGCLLGDSRSASHGPGARGRSSRLRAARTPAAGRKPRVPRAGYLPERLRWPRRRVVDAVERLLGLPVEPADQQQRPRRDVVDEVGRLIRGVIRRSLAAVEAVAEYGWCRRERLCAGTRPGPGYSTTAVCGSGRR